MSNRSSRSNKHFDALDGLRGVAALMVVLGHSSAMMLGHDNAFVFRKKLAVIFFFMLSGFVVTSAYDALIRNGYPIGDFLLRRAIRLYPMIVAGAVLSSISCAFFEPAFRHSWRGLAASLGAILCLPSPHTNFNWWTRFPINPPEWSLFDEITLYIVFAFLLVRFSMPVLILVVVTAFAVYTAADLRSFPSDMPMASLWSGALSAFGIGMLLFRLHDAGSLPNVRPPFVVLGLVIVVMCVIPAWVGPMPDAIAFVILCPMVITAGAARGRGDATRAERLLGKLSFPLYIVHWPFLVVVHHVLQPSLGAATSIACAMALAISAAWCLSLLWDDPVRHRLLAALARQRERSGTLSVAESLRR